MHLISNKSLHTNAIYWAFVICSKKEEILGAHIFSNLMGGLRLMMVSKTMTGWKTQVVSSYKSLSMVLTVVIAIKLYGWIVHF